MCEPKKIIWNPIQERHLRMYCDRQDNMYFIVTPDWAFQKAIYQNYLMKNNPFKEWKTICDLDNTKDFQDQSDEVIESIVKFLEN